MSSAATSVLGAGAGVTVKSAVHPKRMGKILGKNRETSMFFWENMGTKREYLGKCCYRNGIDVYIYIDI